MPRKGGGKKLREIPVIPNSEEPETAQKRHNVSGSPFQAPPGGTYGKNSECDTEWCNFDSFAL